MMRGSVIWKTRKGPSSFEKVPDRARDENSLLPSRLLPITSYSPPPPPRRIPSVIGMNCRLLPLMLSSPENTL